MTLSGAALSDALGTASICAWLFAQAPQVYENYRRGSVESLAPSFLLIWFTGDATNLIGCILTDQLLFQGRVLARQTYLATYFLFIDCILVAQMVHYGRQPSRPHKHRHGRYRDASILPPGTDDPLAASWLSRSMPASAARTPGIATSADPMVASFYSEVLPARHRSESAPRTRQSTSASLDRGRPLHAHTLPSHIHDATLDLGPLLGVVSLIGYHALLPRQKLSTETAAAAVWLDRPPVGVAEVVIDWQRLIGRSAAWICATCYLASRLPQVWKNFRRKSVEGLSALLFMAAFVGNLLYSLSILLSPLAQTDESFLAESVPYLIGSGGTLCFDLTIMGQIVVYRRRKARRQLLRQRRQHAASVVAAPGDEAALLGQSMSEDEGSEDEAGGGYRPSRSRSIARLPATIVEETTPVPTPG